MLRIIKRVLQGFLALLVLALLAAAIILATQVDLSNSKELDAFIQGKMNKAEIPGLSMAIIRDGELVEVKGYGYFDKDKRQPVTQDTLFQIASVSKTITATAVMQLVEKGLLDLDEDINQYLPFPVRHPQYPHIPITVRMLLTHTSGIANNWEVYNSFYTIDSGGGDSPISLEQFVKGFLLPGGQWYDARKNFVPGEPGTVYNYSNPGFALLGYLVEQVAQIPFDQYCEKNIFEPLEMDHAAWLLKDVDLSMLAVPHDEKNQPLPHYSFASYPDGALKVSIKEYAHFIHAILNDGQYKNKTILKPATLDEMFRPQAKAGKVALMWDYGILEDFYMKGLSEKKLAGHTGADPGIFTLVLLHRDSKNGLILFSNKELSLNTKTLNTYFMVRRLIGEAGLTR